MNSKPKEINDQELPTVLAALRYFQANLHDALPLFEECSYFENHESLGSEDIDQLCDRLNSSP